MMQKKKINLIFMHEFSKSEQDYLKKIFIAQSFSDFDNMFYEMVNNQRPSTIIHNILMNFDERREKRLNDPIFDYLNLIITSPEIIGCDFNLTVHLFASFFLQNNKKKILHILYKKSKNKFFFRNLIYSSLHNLHRMNIMSEYNRHINFLMIFAEDDFIEIFDDKLMFEPGIFFIEPFLNLFLYKNSNIENPCDLFLNKDMNLIHNNAKSFIERTTSLGANLKIFLNKIMQNKNIKKYISDYFVKIIEKNQDRLKMQHNEENVISDGFSLNMYYLLLLFSKPIISKNLINLLNGEFIANFDCHIIEGNFTSVIFITTLKMIELSLCKFIEKYKELDRECFFLSNRELTEQEKRIFNIFKSRIYAYKIIFKSDIMKSSVEFVDYFIKCIMLKKIQYDIPLSYYKIIFDILHYKKNIGKGIINLIGKLIEKQDYTDEIIDRIIETYDIHDATIPENQSIFLIDYYIKIDKREDNLTKKISIINILCMNFMYIRNLCNIKFINIFLTDLEKLLFMGLNNLQELNRYIMDNNHNNDETTNINDLEIKIKNSFTAAKFILKYLLLVVKNTKIMGNKLVFGKLVTILNSILKIMVGPKCSSLNIKDKQKYHFEPREILKKILQIYVIIRSYENIEDIIISDKMYFNILLFKKAEEISKNKKILEEHVHFLFSKFVNSLEKKSNEEQQKEDAIQIPDEFIDPLTFDMIEDPVRLRTSNIIIDRSTFDTLMVGDMLDPFNREPITEKDALHDEDFKHKLMKWRSENKF